MKIKNIEDYDRDEILICLNCKYIDIAKHWQFRLPGKCPKCESQAYVNFKFKEDKKEEKKNKEVKDKVK